jgi:hypothetical protein
MVGQGRSDRSQLHSVKRATRLLKIVTKPGKIVEFCRAGAA